MLTLTVILECNVCHSKIFEDADKVEIEGEDANLEEECPYCFSMDGYKVIGQVAPMGQVEEEIEVTEEEPVEAGDEAVNEIYQKGKGKYVKIISENGYTYENDRLKTINHNGFNYKFNYDKAGNNSEVLFGRI